MFNSAEENIKCTQVRHKKDFVIQYFFVTGSKICLTDQDRESLVKGEWLDKIVNAANELLRIKYPTINGLQDPLVLAYNWKFHSGSQRFVLIFNIAQSHWICACSVHLGYSKYMTVCPHTYQIVRDKLQL